MAKKPKKWIKEAIKKPGALRKALKVKKGRTISMKKLEMASHKPGKMGKRARLAMTMMMIRRRRHMA